MQFLNMINVFTGKVRKTGFFQKAGFPGNSERIFGIYYKSSSCTGKWCIAMRAMVVVSRQSRLDPSLRKYANRLSTEYCFPEFGHVK